MQNRNPGTTNGIPNTANPGNIPAPDALQTVSGEMDKLTSELSGVDPAVDQAVNGAREAIRQISVQANGLDTTIRSATQDPYTPEEGRMVRATEAIEKAERTIAEQAGNVQVAADLMAQRLEQAALPKPSTAAAGDQALMRDELKLLLDPVRDSAGLASRMAQVARERPDLAGVLMTPWGRSYAVSRGMGEAHQAARSLMLQDALEGKAGEARARAARALAQLNRLAFLSTSAQTAAQQHVEQVRRTRRVRRAADARPASAESNALQAAAAERRSQS